MNDARAQLLTTFKNQHQFSRDYSPLYASLFAAAAGWLDEGRQEAVGAWLLEAAHGRRPLDVSILLAAGLHREILLKEPELEPLAAYYPSVGGTLAAGHSIEEEDGWTISQEYEQTLSRSIWARREQLRQFIRSNQVQTNETGRGISWLLPVSLAGWPRVHLLDLGASAGLNLCADRRHYRFVDTESGRTYLQLGEGPPAQFELHSSTDSNVLAGAAVQTPSILSRLGCDISPFFLHTPLDEVILAAFVWADQTARLDRLLEGITAFRQVAKNHAAVELHAVELPGGLSALLEQQVEEDSDAIVCYNTYIRLYLPQKRFALRGCLSEWARDQARPVVWIQWEPPSSLNARHGRAPVYGWLAWTIDMWHRGEGHHWHVAWVHPHGRQVQWLPGLRDWIAKARALRL